MPTATIEDRQQRRDAIARILAEQRIARQSQLVDILCAEGYPATQSSVSRDLKDLGATKDPDGYRLPSTGAAVDGRSLEVVAGFVRDMRPAGPNLLVLTTAIGAAQRVALMLDRSQWPEIVGTLSGDDTIFVATSNAATQRRLCARLKESLKQV